MNIFFLHKDPEQAAQMHIDKHVVKIPLEVAQMACTNVRIFNALGEMPTRKLTSEEISIVKKYSDPDRAIPIEQRAIPYLPCHINHPCTIWMRSSIGNWEWAKKYALALEKEYTYRYGKPSLKACDVIRNLPSCGVRTNFMTTPALAMPDQYKADDPVMSYRAYYNGEKASIASWKRRGAPTWWRDVQKTV